MRTTLILSLTLLVVLSLPAPVLAQESTVHIVQPGENLFRIALRYGVTVQEVVTANGLSSAARIYAGQRLVIPGGSPASGPATPSTGTGFHVVQRGENLFRIALRHGLTTQALATANGISNPHHVYVGQRLSIPGQASAPATPAQPTSSGQTYTVRRGDTLSSIAARHGVSVWGLTQANGIRNPSLIYVGQTLRIPAGGTPGETKPPTPSSPAPAPTGGRWIDVDLSAQRLTAYQGDTAVRSTLVSTGLPNTPTPTGQYRVYVKYTSTTMSGPGYYLPGVPYTMYFYRGYGIHGTYWHSNFGHPMSHGCINLPTSEAQWLFNWASVGTLVNIHY